MARFFFRFFENIDKNMIKFPLFLNVILTKNLVSDANYRPFNFFFKFFSLHFLNFRPKILIH